jgi:hypothetical protein
MLRIYCWLVWVTLWQLRLWFRNEFRVIHHRTCSSVTCTSKHTRLPPCRRSVLPTSQQLSIPLLHAIPYRLTPVTPWLVILQTFDLRLVSHMREAKLLLTITASVSPKFFPPIQTTWRCILTAVRSRFSGCAFVYDGQAFAYRLHKYNSVITAEHYAVSTQLYSSSGIHHQQYRLLRRDLLSGSTVTTAWHIPGLRIETASRYGG